MQNIGGNNMSFQPFQLIFLLPIIAWVMILWKMPNNKWKPWVLAILGLLIIFNPFRFEQGSGRSLERFSSVDTELPEKITIEAESFNQRQQSQFKQLENESQEAKDEAIN